MDRKKIALLLAAALALCAVPALAGTDGEGPESRTAVRLEYDEPQDARAAPEPEAAGEAPAEDAGETGEAPEEPDTAPKSSGVWQEGYEGTEPWISSVDDELVFTGETDFRYLAFNDLRDRVLEGSLTARMMEESIASIDAIDFTKMYSELANQLGSLERAQDMYAQIPVATPMEGAMQGYVISNLASSYGSLSSTVSDLATGKLQKDYDAAKRQLENARDQLVIGAESLYIATLELEQTRETLQRNLTALDRTVEEMELRYRLGQISALTLEQVKNGRATLQSSLSTVDMNLKRCKMQLESMTGAGMEGTLRLGPLPDLSDGLIDSMDLRTDLEEAKDKSYDLFAAKKKLKEASDSYDDTQASYAKDTYNLRSARHTYESAKYEYQYTLQTFEMNFRNTYNTVKDYRQALSASRTTLAFQESTYASMELKYQQGNISHNALLDAADDLAEAKEAVATAQRNLFTAYRSYYWAVNYGVTSSAQA